MQEIESTKQQVIDLQTQQQQPQQIKQETFDSLIVNQTNQSNNPQHLDLNNCQSTTSKKSDNRFQASIERQRNLLLNMEQQLISYSLNNNNLIATSFANEPEEDDKVMDYQVDSNNNSMPILLNCNKQSLPSINELKRMNRSTNNFNQNGQFTNQFTNDQASQLNDDNEFSRFVEDDYSRLSHTNASLYDNFELNQSIKIEDAFQDDKLDFKSSPTLAELNLNDDDMMDNLQTVNPNKVLCPSMPLQANKNGFLMGINYTTIGLTSNTNNLTTTTTADSQSTNNRLDLVSSFKYNLSDDQFSSNNNQFEHLSSSTNHKGSIKQEFPENGFNARTTNLSTNAFTTTTAAAEQQTKSAGKASYNTRTRGRNKSQSDKQSNRRTNQNHNQQQQQQQQQQQNLSANNQVLCKLLNEKNDNLNNILLINETTGLVNSAINNGQSIPQISAANLINNSQIQAICVSSLTNSSSSTSITNTQSSNNKAISQLPNDLLLNQSLNQPPIKCALANNNNLKINNATTRNRNSSISTEHSFSSHDEGFISQAEDDSDEKDLIEDQMICDPKLPANKQMAKTKRKRARKDLDKDQRNSKLIEQEATNTSINRNLKKIKLDDNQSKPSTSSGFISTLSTVKEERSSISTNKKDEKVLTKGRVNYKITKEKPIFNEIQQQFKFDNIASKSELIKPSISDEKMDGESSDDEDDDSFYGDYESADLIGATTSDDQLNKWSLNMGRSRKNSAQRYFWQYNVQSKGPKGTKLTTMDNSLEGELPSSTTVGSDLEPLDPVFSPNCMIEGVKHAGKARRGDGNDLTASPRKLLMIGLELKKLSKIINDLTPVAEVPVNNKSNSRKEKNKLASRACRLKKKAQHEANKIKLHGLTVEYKKYASIISEFKKIQEKVCAQPGKFINSDKKLVDQLNALIREKGPIICIAGQTTEFVNSVLDCVSAGNIGGGLEKL